MMLSIVVLPEPAGADQHQQLAVIDLQRDVLEHFDRDLAHLIRLADLVQVQQDVGVGGADHVECGMRSSECGVLASPRLCRGILIPTLSVVPADVGDRRLGHHLGPTSRSTSVGTRLSTNPTYLYKSVLAHSHRITAEARSMVSFFHASLAVVPHSSLVYLAAELAAPLRPKANSSNPRSGPPATTAITPTASRRFW